MGDQANNAIANPKPNQSKAKALRFGSIPQPPRRPLGFGAIDWSPQPIAIGSCKRRTCAFAMSLPAASSSVHEPSFARRLSATNAPTKRDSCALRGRISGSGLSRTGLSGTDLEGERIGLVEEPRVDDRRSVLPVLDRDRLGRSLLSGKAQRSNCNRNQSYTGAATATRMDRDGCRLHVA